MSYSCADQSDSLIAHLAQAGYVIHRGNGFNSQAVSVLTDLPTETQEEVEADAYDANIDGFWFTWTQEGCEIESGETEDSELAAWSDAMDHFFANAKIPTDVADAVPGA